MWILCSGMKVSGAAESLFVMTNKGEATTITPVDFPSIYYPYDTDQGRLHWTLKCSNSNAINLLTISFV